MSRVLRYMLFMGDRYYPSGGWHDFMGFFQTVDEAIEATKPRNIYGWAHVVDPEFGIVWEEQPASQKERLDRAADDIAKIREQLEAK
jgi:hypothetical protein